MSKVYSLKRATPKMKYHHMNMVMDFKRTLADAQKPNSEEWKTSANNALIRLADAIGWDEARRMTTNIEGTWQHIARQIAILANLAEAQVTDWLEDMTDRDGAATGISQPIIF